jgi:two-component system, NarL family, sensor histidine kinase DegS
MLQINRSIMTHRRLLLFKWLMVFLPSVTVTLGHSLMQHADGGTHALPTVAATLPVTFLGLVLTYLFVETLFRGIRRLQAEAVAREQDIQTMNAVMQERERLSRELHDGAAQLVADLLLRLDTIKELVETDRPQQAQAELERLHGVADEIYQDIGESITGLRSNVTERGLVRALQDYLDQFEERHHIPTSLRTDDAAEKLSPLAALQLFRFIQEALTNIRKHAGAHQATVTLTSNGPDQLSVVIADDGQGFTPGSQRNGKARALGLTSMRERVEALGGTFHVNSQPALGTQVSATIPIPPTRRENTHAALATPAG